ncbi:MAG: hypothetical protein AB7J28_13805 [Hyphomonadaceae bacterium]
MFRFALGAALICCAVILPEAHARVAPGYSILRQFERVTPPPSRRASEANLSNHAGLLAPRPTIGAIQCPNEGTAYRVSVPEGSCGYRHDDESRENYVSCSNAPGDRAWASCYQGCGQGVGQGRCTRTR